jgi:hypothetical protein
MAKHQHLTPYQTKIVDRYYEHLDSITITKLQELVSELYLAEPKAAEKLWKRAEAALTKAKVDPARVTKVLSARDVAQFSQLVLSLSKPR